MLGRSATPMLHEFYIEGNQIFAAGIIKAHRVDVNLDLWLLMKLTYVISLPSNIFKRFNSCT
jgi:hypothetical protein